MSKFFILELNGIIQQGITAILLYKDEDNSSFESIRVSGKLPIQQGQGSISEVFRQWIDDLRLSYNPSQTLIIKKPDDNAQITQKKPDYLDSRISCSHNAHTLEKQLNKWLSSPDIGTIREKIIEKSASIDRLLIRATDPIVRALPWHTWQLLRDYKIDVGLAVDEYEIAHHSEFSMTPNDKVKILGILGSILGRKNIGIRQKNILDNTVKDGNCDIHWLEEPTFAELTNLLREESWDILFFAGHSQSDENAKMWGKFLLNESQNIWISIQEIRESLKLAIAKGLKLAIFNSCDGLGLGYQLGVGRELYLPQVIVMREQIYSPIAVTFLKDFLESYTSGSSLYKAIREARQKLFEKYDKDQHPCASWQPVIFQNPYVKPPTWEELGGKRIKRNTNRPEPYKGLSAFKKEDDRFFFGRDDDITKLVEAIESHKSLVSVVGASGVGKSSLVFAGLMPRLDSLTQTLTFRLGDYKEEQNKPLASLAKALCKLILEQDSNQNKQQLSELEWELEISDSEEKLTEKINEWVQSDTRKRLILFIDQFEEVFTLCQSQEEQTIFLDSLVYAIRHAAKFTLILTLRSDFYKEAIKSPFCDAFNEIQSYTLNLSGRLKPKELEEIIAKPLEKLPVKVELEERLKEKLVTDFIADFEKQSEGSLPLLEFTLTQLWEQRENNFISYDSYTKKLGGIQNAIHDHAESVYASLKPGEQKRLKLIFLKLISVKIAPIINNSSNSPDDNITPIRRIANLNSEIAEDDKAIVRKLVNSRLIVTDKNNKGEDIIELAHDILIERWERLSRWIREDRNMIFLNSHIEAIVDHSNPYGRMFGDPHPLKSQLEDFVKYHLNPNSNPNIKALRDPETQRFGIPLIRYLFSILYKDSEDFIRNIFQNTRYDWDALSLDPKVKQYLQKKLELSRGEIISNLGNRTLAVSIVLLILGGLGATVYSGLQHYLINRYRIKSFDISSIDSSENYTLVTTRKHNISLFKSTGEKIKTIAFASNGLNPFSDGFNQGIFSSDGETIAVAFKNEVILWNVNGGEKRTLQKHDDKVTDIVFSPDGKFLASASKDKTIKIRNIENNNERTLRGHDNIVKNIAFSPNGKLLASVGGDGYVKLWTLEGKTRILDEHNGGYFWHDYLDSENYYSFTYGKKIVFSPDGKLLALAQPRIGIDIFKIKNQQLELFRQNILNKDPIISSVDNIHFNFDSKILLAIKRNIIYKVDLGINESRNHVIKDMIFYLGNPNNLFEYSLKPIFNISQVSLNSEDEIIALSNQCGTIKNKNVSSEKLEVIIRSYPNWFDWVFGCSGK